MAAQYFIRRGEKIVSLASFDQLKSNIAKGKVVATDDVALKKDGPWKIIADVPAFSALFSELPIGGNTPPDSDIPPDDQLGSVSMDELAGILGETDYQPSLSPTTPVAREKKLPTKRPTKSPSNDEPFLSKTTIAASVGIIALLVVVVVMAVSFWPEDIGRYFKAQPLKVAVKNEIKGSADPTTKTLIAAASRTRSEDAPRAQLRKIVDHFWSSDNRQSYLVQTGNFDTDHWENEGFSCLPRYDGWIARKTTLGEDSLSLVGANTQSLTFNAQQLVGKSQQFVGKSMVKTFGADSRFWSEPQFAIGKTPEGEWMVTPNTNAANATILNGFTITGSRSLTNRSQLAVCAEVAADPDRRVSKDLIKLPLKVEVVKKPPEERVRTSVATLVGCDYVPATNTCTFTITVTSQYTLTVGIEEVSNPTVTVGVRVTTYFSSGGVFGSGRWNVEKVENVADGAYLLVRPQNIYEGYFEVLFDAVK